MIAAPLRTVLIGLGQIGARYDEDPLTKLHYQYATHAQVLRDHPEFHWVGACDSAPASRRAAAERWPDLCVCESINELAALDPEVVVLATGPNERLQTIAPFRRLKGILCEKPIATTSADGRSFIDACRHRRVALQVNHWRRADVLMRQLAGGELAERLGRVQNLVCHYGNGLRNNGVHCVDLCRMLLGEFRSVQAVGTIVTNQSAGVAEDLMFPFVATTQTGALATFHPLDFAHYREIAFDIWGTHGRVRIDQEGLRCCAFPVTDHRAIQGEREIASDQCQILKSTAGTAFFHLYSNLAVSIRRGEQLWSSGESAMQSQAVVESAIQSARHDGMRIELTGKDESCLRRAS